MDNHCEASSAYSAEIAMDYNAKPDRKSYADSYRTKMDVPKRSRKGGYRKKECDDNVCLIGNSVNFHIDEKDNELKVDVIVGYKDSVRVWGQIRDCEGRPVGCAYVKLVKMTCNGLVGVAHTVSDCLGFYQFDVCPYNDGCDFTIIVGKAATGSERSVTSGFEGLNCSPEICNDNCMPCQSNMK